MPDTGIRRFAQVLCLFCVAMLMTLSAATAQTGPSPTSPGFRTLFKGLSKKNLVATTLDHRSLLSPARDTVRVIAFRVQFAKDSSNLTTGTGLFGSADDRQEIKGYDSDTIYTYDNLLHDKSYFEHQLEYVQTYFTTVSRGRLSLQYEVYPTADAGAFNLPKPMTYYSPGGKKKKESFDQYYNRKSIGFMRFVRDAIAEVSSTRTVFSSLRRDPTSGAIVDSTGRKVVFLVFHAGASYLTDGGKDGYFGQDTPSDMIDAFVNGDFFSYYRDTLGLDTSGVFVPTAGGDSILLDEVMLCSETSNQDGLNWGIHGILINQIARQLGIPDLWSTSSGISGIGAFCIMDFAGYSAGYGFIPPYPSAWVRLFMGWDSPVTVQPGVAAQCRVRAIGAARSESDTTMLLVPINDHEYYLIENRQRNLSGDPSWFKYDTSENKDTVYIAPYPYNVNLDSVVAGTDGTSSNCILGAKNYDVSLPASGLLVWHIDENIVRDRIGLNMVNADSTYKGVSLVEADGINDVGVMFTDLFSQAAFDYGGAEDVFPHANIKFKTAGEYIDSMGPFTRPSTMSNDGGHTYCTMAFGATSAEPAEEKSSIRGYYVVNYADSVMEVSVDWTSPVPTVGAAETGVRPTAVPGWPRRMLADSVFFEPVMCNVYRGDAAKELAVVTNSGRLYLWSTDPARTHGFGRLLDSVRTIDIAQQDSIRPDTTRPALGWQSVSGLSTPARPLALPTSIAGRLYVPTVDGVSILDSISITDAAADPDTTAVASWRMVGLPATPSSYVASIEGGLWAVGCSNGAVVFADTATDVDTTVVRLDHTSPVCALAALRGEAGIVACMSLDGTLAIVDKASGRVDSVRVGGIGPYSVVTGDLDNDNSNEIVVTDSRMGVWCFRRDLSVAPGWHTTPVDWPSVYTYQEKQGELSRSLLPTNVSSPSLADINGDGCLDIVVGGTNGLYALNYKGVLLYGWPSYLDTRFWYYRQSVKMTPVVAVDDQEKPLVLFSAPTGEKETFSFFHIDSVSAARTKVYFTRHDGATDSIGGLKASLVDTLLRYGDSLVPDYIIPGGLVDARNSKGVRPGFVNTLANVGPERQSYWPMTVGSSPACAPLVGDADGDGTADMFAVTKSGWIYRWGLSHTASDMFWPQVGYSGARQFAYMGSQAQATAGNGRPLSLFSYPNPTNGASSVMFRFKFSGPAQNVRLDIYTYTGLHVYSWKAPMSAYMVNWRDWNELPTPFSLRNYAAGVYRCRMEAKVNGKPQSVVWKMAVVK